MTDDNDKPVKPLAVQNPEDEPAPEEREPATAPDSADDDRAPPAPRSQSSGPAWLALLIGLAALLSAWYAWWDAQRAAETREQTASALESTLAAMRSEVQGEVSSGVQAAREAMSEDLDELSRRDERLEHSVAARDREIQELKTRLRAAERALEERAGTSVSARDALLRSEVEQSLRIANRAATLARDREMALASLRLADDRLRELDDPGLAPVREAVTSDIDALEAVEQPDIEGIALRLARMTGNVEELPLAKRQGADAARDDGPAPDAEEAPSDSDFLSRISSALRGAFSNLVRVRRSDEEVTPLLAPDEQFFLRQNLRLALETARLAALRGDPANYAVSLRQAREWLVEYFDTEHSSVAQMVAALDNLARAELQTELPDLSGSLDALRNLKRESR
ncbi:hypothetical protein BH24PSE2_BH24PSE2_09980 [soil metagenome]